MTRGGFRPGDDSERPFEELVRPREPDATDSIPQPDATVTQSLGQELFVEMNKPSNDNGPINNDSVAEYIEGKVGETKSPIEKRVTVVVGTVLILCICLILIGIALRVLAWGLKPWIG